MIGSWSNAFFYSWYVMFPLLGCSIASLAIILERIISLRPDSVAISAPGFWRWAFRF